jgi:hypothetical protein
MNYQDPMPSSGRKRVAESQYDKSSLHPSYEQHSSSMSNPQGKNNTNPRKRGYIVLV